MGEMIVDEILTPQDGIDKARTVDIV